MHKAKEKTTWLASLINFVRRDGGFVFVFVFVFSNHIDLHHHLGLLMQIVSVYAAGLLIFHSYGTRLKFK